MAPARSRLKHLLHGLGMTVSDLRRLAEQNGERLDMRSLRRLTDDRRPLRRLDLRLAAIICNVCRVPLSELIAFDNGRQGLRQLPTAQQKKLDALMDRNNEGILTPAEHSELRRLVRRVERLSRENARALASPRRLSTG